MLFEPYFWLHIAGLGLLPLLWAGVAIALALGMPFPFANLELLLIVLLGGVPVWILQIWRPWQPFSVLFFQVRPEQMNEHQRQLLRLVQGTRQPILNVIGAIVMVLLLWQVTHYSPLSISIGLKLLLPQWHILGFLGAVICFLIINFLLQIPLTLLPAMVLSEEAARNIDPHPVTSIRRDFACWGIPLGSLFLSRRP